MANFNHFPLSFNPVLSWIERSVISPHSTMYLSQRNRRKEYRNHQLTMDQNLHVQQIFPPN